jgi:hypothetical protein
MFHVNFYLPAVNAYYLQANHFLTITPTRFGISQRYIQGVFFSVFVTHQTSQTVTDYYITIFTQNTHFILPFEINTLVGTLKYLNN